MSSSCSCTKDEWGRCCCMYQGTNKSSLVGCTAVASTKGWDRTEGKTWGNGGAWAHLPAAGIWLGRHTELWGPQWGVCAVPACWACVPQCPGWAGGQLPMESWSAALGGIWVAPLSLQMVIWWVPGQASSKVRLFSQLESPGRYSSAFPVEFL